ncbi:hypothetical protein V3C99_003011 [Haemonchus contortus]
MSFEFRSSLPTPIARLRSCNAYRRKKLIYHIIYLTIVRISFNSFWGHKEQTRPRPLPPPPPHIELAGSGTKEDHTLRDVASLTRDDDSSKKVKKKPNQGPPDDILL